MEGNSGALFVARMRDAEDLVMMMPANEQVVGTVTFTCK